MEAPVDRRIAEMKEAVALPRKNGELVFEAPWEARAFGMAVALNEGGAYAWPEFSARLAGEIAEAEREAATSSYYERWLASLEKLALERGLVSRDELAARAAEYASGAHDGHGHSGAGGG